MEVSDRKNFVEGFLVLIREWEYCLSKLSEHLRVLGTPSEGEGESQICRLIIDARNKYF